MGRACGMYGVREVVYSFMVGQPERKRPLGRLRHGCEDNIKMALKEVGWGWMDWIDLAEDRDR